MAVDWLSVRDEVSEALAEVGFEATLRRRVMGGPAYNPSVSSVQDTTITVVEDITEDDDGESRRLLLVAVPATVVPQEKDQVLVGGVEFEVVQADALRPGGVDLMYELRLSSG